MAPETPIRSVAWGEPRTHFVCRRFHLLPRVTCFVSLQVAVRNSAMIVLSTLVRKVGLEVATPHLVKSGMHAVHWRPREGALRLVIGGLLLSTTSSICDLSRGSSAQGAGGAENVSGSRAEEQEFKRLPPRSSRNEDRDGRGGCSIPANSSRALVGERSSHVSAEMQEEQGVSLPPDRQWLAGEVGRLLTDKRHEVCRDNTRFHPESGKPGSSPV